jgi:hypothetical protein
VWVRPQHAKNDQYLSVSGGWWRPLEVSSVTQAVQRWLALRGDAAGPLWLTAQRRPLARGWLNKLAKKLTEALEAPGTFSGHSFRIGGATAAVAGGMEVGLIAATGLWRSDAVLLYLRSIAAAAAGMTAAMGL